MAQRTLHSNTSINFLDYTDSRRLDVYIASNTPTIQIYNPNTSIYTPDWSTTQLTLSVTAFIDGAQIDTGATFQWYKKTNSETSKTLIANANTSTLTIATNVLSNIDIITYICKVTYQGIESQAQITFSKVMTGQDGDPGTSFSIKGTASSVTQITGTDYYTIIYGPGVITSAQLGDAYIYNGHLYVCADSRSGDDYFIDVGSVQGPAGQDAKNIILTADNQIFKVSKNNVISPSTITVVATPVNTTITTWSYSINGGQTFLSTAPSGVVRNGNSVVVTGANMPSETIVIKASDGTYFDTYTIYKVQDGSDGTPGNPGTPAPIVFLTNENISFSADSQGQITTTSVTTNVVAYSGNTKVQPTIGTITGIPDGMTITTGNVLDEIMLTLSVANNATFGSSSSNDGTISIPVTSPVNTVLHLSWSKINTGLMGESGQDAVVFQVYSENGYVLSQNTPNITLKTFAYNGSAPITAGATYQWYTIDDGIQTVIAGATQSELEISHSDVFYSASYMCKMTFNDLEYIGVVTIDDKNDANTVFTSKPTSYLAGDIWVVGDDYQPQNIEIGTVLKAQHSNTVYADSDWVTATKYDEQLRDLQEDVDKYNQYFSFDQQDGLRISARDVDGNQSKFSTTLSNTQLSFNEGNEAIAYISGNKMHIKEAEIESPLSVVGQYSSNTMLQAPIINIGSFSLVVESNGSLSIVSNL